jgi:hypothetical protein
MRFRGFFLGFESMPKNLAKHVNKIK